VVTAEHAGQPALEQWSGCLQHGNRGMGHRNRAGVTRLNLGEEHERSGAGDVGAEARVRPGRGVCAVSDSVRDDAGVRGVILDLVDAGTVAVERVQYGRVRVGKLCVMLETCRTHQSSDLLQLIERPRGVVADYALDEWCVARELVDVDRSEERRVRKECRSRWWPEQENRK